MPDLVSVSATDLAQVAQYAKTNATQRNVWNAACRLLDTLHSSKETTDAH